MLMNKLATQKDKIASRFDKIDNNRTKVIRRAGLIDQALLHNKKAHRSYAERKRLWCGEDGEHFEVKDLASWYKIYNQTKLAQMKEIFRKDIIF